MIFRFDGGQRDRLLEQPESGMGYQLAEADPFVFLTLRSPLGSTMMRCKAVMSNG